MKTTAVLQAVAQFWLGPRLFDSVSSYELVEAVRDKCHFSRSPDLSQLSGASNQPVTFTYGKTNVEGRAVTIEQLIVSYVDTRATSIVAATRTSTDDAEAFLTDLIAWAREEFNLNVDQVYPITYLSHLEVSLDRSIDQKFQDLQKLGRTVGEFLKGYNFESAPDFTLSGLSLHFDTTTPQPILWSPFSIERRVGASYQENRYYSQAPLQTRHHEEVLRQFEKML